MARFMDREAPIAFRAVITTVETYSPEYRVRRDDTEEGHTYTSYRGPYSTIGAARAAITREKRDAGTWWGGARTVTGYVERSSQEWTRVDD